MANGDPKDGGIVDFEGIEGVFTCLKFLHNLKICDSQLIAKANQKTCTYLNDIKDLRRAEYIQYLNDQKVQNLQREPVDNGKDEPGSDHGNPGEDSNDQAIPDAEELKSKEELGDALTNGILPYELDMIYGGSDQYDQIYDNIQRLVDQKENPEIEKKEPRSAEDSENLGRNGSAASRKNSLNDSRSSREHEEYDPLRQFKEHEREKQREKKLKTMQEDRELRFKRKLEDLLRWEKVRDREKNRELDRHQNFTKVKQQLIDDDLNYDSAEEKRRVKKYPKEYQRYQDERKRVRAREAKDDEIDRKLEEEELAEIQKKKLEELKKQEEQRKKDEEIRERLKLKRFMEMHEEIANREKYE